MKVEREIKQSVTKGDILLIISLVALSVFLFALSFFGSNKELTVRVYSSSELVWESELSKAQGEKLFLDGCEIIIEKDGVYFSNSDCPDQLCVKRGKLRNSGDTMACVPKKVAVVLTHSKDKSKIDALTY